MHFEYSLLEEMQKLVTLKGSKVALAQENIMLVDVTQGSAVVGKSCVQEKGKRKVRELEKEEETLV